MADHDRSYKQLFSHPAMVRDLLAGFVHEDWVAQLDYHSLEKVDPSHIGSRLALRTNDLVWRVRWGEGFLYVYLMLEFQSSVDPYMALRMLTYIGLLHEGLIRTEQLSGDKCLPPVLPIVLYNGSKPWHAARELTPLLQRGPAALTPYQPQMRYLLIDQARYDEHVLSSMRNLAAAAFRLEQGRTNVQIGTVLAALEEWLRSPQYENLRHDFSAWAHRTILKRFPSYPAEHFTDVSEIRSMFANLEEEWKANWKAEGLAEGRAAGRAEGRAQGIAEGRRQGQLAALLPLLHARFGPMPCEARTRIEHASVEQLNQWTLRLLSVDSLEALLSDQD